MFIPSKFKTLLILKMFLGLFWGPLILRIDPHGSQFPTATRSRRRSRIQS